MRETPGGNRAAIIKDPTTISFQPSSGSVALNKKLLQFFYPIVEFNLSIHIHCTLQLQFPHTQTHCRHGRFFHFAKDNRE
jgi:hypothetical protein